MLHLGCCVVLFILIVFFCFDSDDMGCIRKITAKDICMVYGQEGEVGDGSGLEPALPHLLLMHATILFPAFIRRLLEKLEIKGEQKVSGKSSSLAVLQEHQGDEPTTAKLQNLCVSALACMRMGLAAADSLFPDVPWDTLLFAEPLWTQQCLSHQTCARRAPKIST